MKKRLNPNAIALVGFATGLGAVLGNTVLGLTIGLGTVTLCTILAAIR